MRKSIYTPLFLLWNGKVAFSGKVRKPAETNLEYSLLRDKGSCIYHSKFIIKKTTVDNDGLLRNVQNDSFVNCFLYQFGIVFCIDSEMFLYQLKDTLYALGDSLYVLKGAMYLLRDGIYALVDGLYVLRDCI